MTSPRQTYTQQRLTKRTLSKHRHASPSAPWPWVDLNDKVDTAQDQDPKWECQCLDGRCNDCWKGYPQSLFHNWTETQVKKSGMKEYVPTMATTLFRVDVLKDGSFKDPGKTVAPKEQDGFWQTLQDMKREENVRLRVFFAEHLSVPVMQMLGTRYVVEPFFWTSSVNWIPSRYQENASPKEGDHITVILSFPRPMEGDRKLKLSELSDADMVKKDIDTQSPLPLQWDEEIQGNKESRNYLLTLDLLSIHLVRGQKNTIITYRPRSDPHITSAQSLHSRVYLAGQSVYWTKIFQVSKDPTFVLLAMLWYALYAWDQSLELLWEYISQLELHVLKSNSINFTHELHKIRAYLLHYASLLEDFRKTVNFVYDTPNPAMDALEEEEREFSRKLLKKECDNLMTQIDRLANSRVMWDKRLTNVMHLAFSSVNIEDSKQMKWLTEAAVRDSAAMKQIAYLTMIFLPASFVATVFGMNITELAENTYGTLGHYFAAAFPLTIVTVWVIVAMQGRWTYASGEEMQMSLLGRLSWPMLYFRRVSNRSQEWTKRVRALYQRKQPAAENVELREYKEEDADVQIPTLPR
ncbi:hypothetical protein M422DRAFT_207377 [Sphaerobolus stellatus SS14]|uniref:Uncharacterized protein n=1 Tax=Sphaerobolus stellatus (strain SS14) TaxID=990650 RepID=A0A0C9W2B2_SPHS4|nr:hypothetical protein M422DRAFT_207377 [Sphaerobolus stellatus SS14]